MEFQSWWDIALGVLAIITAITGIFVFIQKQLPSNNVQTMYDILDDTTSLLLSCEEEGYISADAADDFRRKLAWLRANADETRLQSVAAKNDSEELSNWLSGLTTKISNICQDVRQIRSKISTSSMRAREQLAAQRREQEAREGKSADSPGNANVGNHADPSPQEHFCSPDVVNGTAERVTAPLDQVHTSDAQNLATHSAVSGLVHTSQETSPNTLKFQTKRSRKLRHSDRRCSDSSNSSGSAVSSLHNVRWKRKVDPLSRARAMATFLRYCRVRQPPGLPVYVVDPRELAVCELEEVEDSDSSEDDWIDEQAVRVMA